MHRRELVYDTSSLSQHRASATLLLNLAPGQWSIENRSHYVHDVTFDEECSHIRMGNIPQIMAALRNTAIGSIHCARQPSIAAACRRFAAHPWSALALVGISQKTE